MDGHTSTWQLQESVNAQHANWHTSSYHEILFCDSYVQVEGDIEGLTKRNTYCSYDLNNFTGVNAFCQSHDRIPNFTGMCISTIALI